jgi:hypothetical protein
MHPASRSRPPRSPSCICTKREVDRSPFRSSAGRMSFTLQYLKLHHPFTELLSKGSGGGACIHSRRAPHLHVKLPPAAGMQIPPFCLALHGSPTAHAPAGPPRENVNV